MYQRVSIGAAHVDVLDWPSVLARLPELISRGGVVAAVNPEKCLSSAEDAQLSGFLERADVLIPDGIGIVLTLRAMGFSRVSRVAGCDLALELCKAAHAEKTGVFLVGADPESNSRAARYIETQFEGVVMGRRDGFNGVRDFKEMVAEYKRSGASVMLVAMGSPRQEKFISELIGAKIPGLFMGVDGTFDVWAGKVTRAPVGWQKLGLEWLYRLLSQPSRLRRQVRLAKFFGVALSAVRTHKRSGAIG